MVFHQRAQWLRPGAACGTITTAHFSRRESASRFIAYASVSRAMPHGVWGKPSRLDSMGTHSSAVPAQSPIAAGLHDSSSDAPGRQPTLAIRVISGSLSAFTT